MWASDLRTFILQLNGIDIVWLPQHEAEEPPF